MQFFREKGQIVGCYPPRSWPPFEKSATEGRSPFHVRLFKTSKTKQKTKPVDIMQTSILI